MAKEIKNVNMNENEEMQQNQDQNQVPAVVEEEGKVKAFLKKAKPIAKKVGKGVAVAAAVVGALTIGKAIGRKEGSGTSNLDPVDTDWEEVPEEAEVSEETFEES